VRDLERDLRVDPAVAALLPASLLATLRTGPHPATYRCGNCLEPGDLAAGEATALALRRYPMRRLRRVQLRHAACGPSQVTVASPALEDLELACEDGNSVVYADLFHGGPAALTGSRPCPVIVLDDNNDLITTDPRTSGSSGTLLPGELVEPTVALALETGLVLFSPRVEPPLVSRWSVRVGPRLLDLVHPHGGGVAIERLPHHIPAGWRAAVRDGGNQALLFVGRIGLSTSAHLPHALPPGSWPRVTTPASSGAAFALLNAAHCGRVAAGRVSVEWARLG
jgi:hypothetical protein